MKPKDMSSMGLLTVIERPILLKQFSFQIHLKLLPVPLMVTLLSGISV
jgi:hypothetical protein